MLRLGYLSVAQDGWETPVHSSGYVRLWALPSVLLALFGGTCAFMSRVQADMESGVAWMTFAGLALQLIVGILLCRWSFPTISTIRSRSIHLVALGTVVLLSVMRSLFGSQISFACVQLLLVIGMMYQTASMVLLYKVACEKGWSKVGAALVGGILCSASVVLVEVGARRFLPTPITESDTFIWSVACAIFSSVFLWLFLMFDNREMGDKTSGAGSPPVIDQIVVSSKACIKNAPAADPDDFSLHGVSFEQAQALWEVGLSGRLACAAKAYGLTKREKEVLGCLAHGDPLQTIADRMYVSRGTIKSHASRIYRKMGVSSRYEAVDAIMKDSG